MKIENCNLANKDSLNTRKDGTDFEDERMERGKSAISNYGDYFQYLPFRIFFHQN